MYSGYYKDGCLLRYHFHTIKDLLKHTGQATIPSPMIQSAAVEEELYLEIHPC